MNLCSDDHDEVCYDGRLCPLCKVREEMQDIISGLTNRCSDHEATIGELNERIDELESCPLLLAAVQESNHSSSSPVMTPS